MTPKPVRVECLIQTSTFEEERLFQIEPVEGRPYAGLAPAHYCHTLAGQRFPPGEPRKETPGLVDARLVQNGGDTAWVYLPNGDTILVRASSIQRRDAAERTRVPVR